MASLFSELIAQGNAISDKLDSIAIDPLVETVGRSPDQLRIFVIFLLQYPNGWFMHYCLHGTALRHIYNIVLGLCIQCWLYGV